MLLTSAEPVIHAPQVWAMGYTGSGQTVAIINSGVDRTHPFLNNHVIAEACYSGGGSTTRSNCPGGGTIQTGTGSASPSTCFTKSNDAICAHGTHVSGIAAGYQSSNFSGVAPNANIIAIDVFSSVTGGITAYDSDIISGLNYVYNLRSSYSIAAVNMSLGDAGRGSSTYCDSASSSMTSIFQTLRNVGIAPVVATGNNGWSNFVSFPACISSAVSVGASTDADAVSSFSNTSGSIQSLFAPGSSITSSVPVGSIADGNGTGYATWDGTSMATPFITGAFAVYRQLSPGASVDTIANLFRATGHSITVSGGSVPRLDLLAAISGTILTPPNDLIGNATSINSLPYNVVQGNIAYATTTGGDPVYCQSVSQTVWYRFTSPVTQSLSVNTIGSNYDTVLAVFNAGTLASVGCDNDSGGNHTSSLTVNVTQGTTYYIGIGVYGAGAPSNASLTLNVSGGGAPPLTKGNTFQDNSGYLLYNGGWGTASNGAYSGGTSHFSGAPGASVTFTISANAGDRLTILRATGPDKAPIQVCFSGIYSCQTFTSQSDYLYYQQPYTVFVPWTATYPVTITHMGSVGQYIDLDAVSLSAAPSALTAGNGFQDSSSNLNYNGAWGSASNEVYDGGSVRYTGVPNSSYSFTVTATAGDRLTLVRSLGPDKGSMRVCFSEVYNCQTVSNNSPVPLFQQAYTVAVPWTATYPVTVTFVGVIGQYLDFDAVALASAPVALTVGGTFQDSDANLTYKGAWASASGSYDGGTTHYSGQAGASVSFSINAISGDRLEITRVMGPDRGTMAVCIGGQCVTYSNYATGLMVQQPLSILLPNSGIYPVTITHTGVTGQYLDLDAVRLSSGPNALTVGTTFEENDSNLVYSGAWGTGSGGGYSGGQVAYTGQPGARVSFMVTATAGQYLVIYRTLAPDKGTMEVCFSQVYACQTVSNVSGGLQFQRPVSIALPWTASYPVTVRFSGSAGQYLDFDKVTISSTLVQALADTPTPTVTDTGTPTPTMTDTGHRLTPIHRCRRRR